MSGVRPTRSVTGPTTSSAIPIPSVAAETLSAARKVYTEDRRKFPADRDPAPFALAIVDARLAACVNVLGEMQSTYRWAGQVETATERQLVIKTVAERVPALEARLRALHPYEVPEFLVIPTAGGSDGYVAWLREMTGQQD